MSILREVWATKWNFERAKYHQKICKDFVKSYSSLLITSTVGSQTNLFGS